MTPDAERLALALSEESNNAELLGKRAYYGAIAVIVIAALAQSAAVIIAMTDVDRIARAIVTAVGASALLLNNALQLEAKSRWHFAKAKRCKALAWRLEFERAPVDQVSAARRILLADMENAWPRFNFGAFERNGAEGRNEAADQTSADAQLDEHKALPR